MSPRRPERVVVAGSAAQNPSYGGHLWVFLQYLLGFRRLGHDVLLVDRLRPEMLNDPPAGGALKRSHELRRLTSVLRRYHLSDSFIVLDHNGEPIAGITRREAIARTRTACALINISGFLDDAEILAAARRRVFLDLDPGFPQMWRELGLADVLAGHDVFATVAGRIGAGDCVIPTCGLRWIVTRPPVVLEQWPAMKAPARIGFATVGAWRGPTGPVEYGGETYGLRVHEFRALAELPTRTAASFEAALDIDHADRADAELLRDGGWGLVKPAPATADPASYRRFIRAHAAELMVAKQMYVRTRGGWFSDRSACFMASGRPVLATDTGLDGLYPTGRGLLTFTSPSGAIDGARAILADYTRHARAARSIAERYFDSDAVLTELLAAVQDR